MTTINSIAIQQAVQAFKKMVKQGASLDKAFDSVFDSVSEVVGEERFLSLCLQSVTVEQNLSFA